MVVRGSSRRFCGRVKLIEVEIRAVVGVCGGVEVAVGQVWGPRSAGLRDQVLGGAGSTERDVVFFAGSERCVFVWSQGFGSRS